MKIWWHLVRWDRGKTEADILAGRLEEVSKPGRERGEEERRSLDQGTSSRNNHDVLCKTGYVVATYFFSSLTLSQSSFRACLIAGSTFVWYFSRYDSSKFLNSFPSDITVPSLASSFITFLWRSAMTSRSSSSSTDYWLEKTLRFWAALRDVTCLLLQWRNLFVKSLCKLKNGGLHSKRDYFVQ